MKYIYTKGTKVNLIQTSCPSHVCHWHSILYLEKNALLCIIYTFDKDDNLKKKKSYL